MIYVVLKERLANNLFQVGAALSLSSDVTICITDSSDREYFYKHNSAFFEGIPVIDHIPNCSNYYKEPRFEYDMIPYKNGEDIIIDGYFQSYRYLDRLKVTQQYGITQRTKKLIECQFPQILSGDYNSILVRRGDYLNIQYKHPFCGKQYYLNAIEKIGFDKKYLVISDDIEWCKKHFKGNNFLFITGTSQIIDLYLPSYCQNNIISNSSFGWWGAYLNTNSNKKVFVPKMWFGFKYKVDTADLLPQNYERVDNKYSFRQLMQAYISYYTLVSEYHFKRIYDKY